jgi:hypothetical protein
MACRLQRPAFNMSIDERKLPWRQVRVSRLSLSIAICTAHGTAVPAVMHGGQ